MYVTVRLSSPELSLIRQHAQAAAIGGMSNIRGTDRASTLLDDQHIGQLGQAALHRYYYGHTLEYAKERLMQNRQPTTGDLGQDILGSNLDVKTSLMRASNDPYKYNLAVRPRERHPGHIYILALVPDPVGQTVYLMGWATDDELPDRPVEVGPLKGAYVLPATALHPMMPVHWSFFNAA